MSKHLLILLCILFLGGLLRFIWLDKIPHSVNGDELHYLISAKSFALTGKDITQAVNPFDTLIFHYPPLEMVQAELPYFLAMVTVGWLPFSLVGNALPNATLSFLIIILLYAIAKKLLNEQVALITAFVAALNPWFIVMGRTSYEMITATAFFLCAFYILLITKGWRILFALPFFILAFYSYIATKLIFIPVVLVLCIYCYFVVNKKHFAKQYLILLLISVLFVGFYFFQLKSSPQTDRLSELMTPSSVAVAEQVDQARKMSVKSPLLYIFENKFSVFVRALTINAYDAISPTYLFIHGDYFFLLGKHGFFYVLDFIFFILGFMRLANKNNKLLILLIALIGISIIPQVVHSSSIKSGNFSPHITLLMPFFVFIVAAGIWQLLLISKKKKNFVAGIIFVLYFIFLGNFLNIYFFEMPLQSNFYNFPDHLLAKYISLAKTSHQHVLVYAQDPRGKFEEYLFYTNTYNSNTADKVSNDFKNKDYTLENVTFLSCNSTIRNIKKGDVAISHLLCDMKIAGDHYSIASLSDSGMVYQITQDKICKNSALKPFISGFKLGDFNPDNMSAKQFCETFIMVR